MVLHVMLLEGHLWVDTLGAKKPANQAGFLLLAERESILRLFVTVRSYSSLFLQSLIDKGLQSLIVLYCPLLFVYDRSIMYVT